MVNRFCCIGPIRRGLNCLLTSVNQIISTNTLFGTLIIVLPISQNVVALVPFIFVQINVLFD